MSRAELRVGFVGVGNIGGPMAATLARRFDVVVHDARPEAAAAVPGARAVPAVAEVARAAPVVCVAVYDDAQVEAVVMGLLAGTRPGHTILVHSTVRAATVRRLAAVAAGSGVAVLDVAVAGGDAAARAGRLTLMAGGDAAALAAVQPVLAALGTVFHVGPAGAGVAAKLVNNLVLHVGFRVLEEALALGRAAGVAERDLVAVLDAGTARSWLTGNLDYYRRQVREVLPPDLVAKDVAAALGLADGLHAPLCRLAARIAAEGDR